MTCVAVHTRRPLGRSCRNDQAGGYKQGRSQSSASAFRLVPVPLLTGEYKAKPVRTGIENVGIRPRGLLPRTIEATKSGNGISRKTGIGNRPRSPLSTTRPANYRRRPSSAGKMRTRSVYTPIRFGTPPVNGGGHQVVPKRQELPNSVAFAGPAPFGPRIASHLTECGVYP
jgi:hypothetical protein